MSKPAAKGRRVLRGFLWLIAGVAILLLLVTALATFMFTTERGTRWALALGERWIPPEISWSETRGSLAGPLELLGLEYESASLTLRAERVVLDWQPLQLVHSQAQIDSIRITGLHAEVRPDTSAPEAVPDSSDTATVSDSLVLPFAVAIDTFILSGATVVVPGAVEIYDASIHLRGTPDAYSVALAATAQAPEVPKARIALAGHGSLVALALSQLTVESGGATIEGAGSVAWEPAVAWQLNLTGDQIDPAAFRPELEDLFGALSFVIRTDGTLAGGDLYLQAAVDTLHGMLAEEAVEAKLQARIDGDHYDVPEASLVWGSLQVDAEVSYQDTVVAAFQVWAPDLSLVIPDAEGALELTGTASGPPAELNVSARVESESLAYGDVALAGLEGDLAVAAGGKSASHADLLVRGLTHPMITLDSARIDLAGTLTDHTLQVDVVADKADASLLLVGGWLDTAWQGDLQRLDLKTDVTRDWSLAEPAALYLSQPLMRLSPLCLQAEPGLLCVDGIYAPTGFYQITATLERFPLERLQPLLPEGMAVSGALDAALDAESADGVLRVLADVNAGSGHVTLQLAGQMDTVFYDQAAAHLSVAPDTLDTEVKAAFRTPSSPRAATIFAQAHLPGLPPADDSTPVADLLGNYLQGDWSCSLQVAGFGFALLQRHLPKGAEIEGGLDLNLGAHSVTDQGYALDFDLNVEQGSLQVPVDRDTAMIRWSDSYLRVHGDSGGVHGTLNSELALRDGTQMGKITGEVSLPELRTLAQIADDIPLAAHLNGVIDLAVVDLLTRQLADTRGQIKINTEITGTTREVDAMGRIDVTGGTNHRDLGIHLEDLQLYAEGVDEGIRLGGQVRSGKGSISLEGLVSNLPSAESPSRIGLKGDRFLAMATPEVQMEVSPDLEVVFTGANLNVTGTVTVPMAKIEVIELPESAVPVSKDVVFVGPEAEVDSGLTALSARVKLVLGDDVFFRGFNFSSFLEGDLEVTERPGQVTQGRGELRFREGFYRGYGQNLTVDPGRLVFAGPLDNPSLDVLAFRRFEDNVRVGFKISGDLQDPKVDTYSDPAKTDDEVMSYILFGRSMQSGSQSEQMRASEAAAYLGGNILAAQAASRVGLDDARIEPGSKRNDAAFFAGKYLSPRLYVAYGTGIYESMNTLRVRYILSRHFTLQAETGSRETADIVYQIER